MDEHTNQTHHDKIRPAHFTRDCFACLGLFPGYLATLFLIPELKGEPRLIHPPIGPFPSFGFTRGGSSIPMDWAISDLSGANRKTSQG